MIVFESENEPILLDLLGEETELTGPPLHTRLRTVEQCPTLPCFCMGITRSTHFNDWISRTGSGFIQYDYLVGFCRFCLEQADRWMVLPRNFHPGVGVSEKSERIYDQRPTQMAE
jgi:hypothetical protein